VRTGPGQTMVTRTPVPRSSALRRAVRVLDEAQDRMFVGLAAGDRDRLHALVGRVLADVRAAGGAAEPC
jgi:hypothetical protein